MAPATDACIPSRLRRAWSIVRGGRRPRRASGHHRLVASDGDDQADTWPRDSLQGRLVLFDALAMKFRELKLRKNAGCPMCGTNRTIHNLSTTTNSRYPRRRGAREQSASSRNHTARTEAASDRGDDLFILDVREPMNTDLQSE